jgi:hypothetical protein
MKYHYLILAAFLFLTQHSIAQRKSENATVTFNNGKVANGYIAIRAAYTYSNSILFSPSEEGEFIDYPAASIRSYTIGDLQYERFEIDSELRLLFYLTRGRIDLLQLEEQGMTRFYIKSPEKPIAHLYYKETITSSGLLHKGEAYKETLTSAMSDCPTIASKIKSITLFNSDNLMRIFKKYYECVGDNTAKVDEKTKSLDMFAGAFGGVSFSDPHFTLVGVNLDFVPLRKKISFISLYYQHGSYNDEIKVQGQVYGQKKRLSSFGAKFSVILVSLRSFEPYLLGAIGMVDYKFTNQPTYGALGFSGLREYDLRHISIGIGGGLKFRPSESFAFKLEFNHNAIPQKTTFDGYAQSLAALTAGIAFKIN